MPVSNQANKYQQLHFTKLLINAFSNRTNFKDGRRRIISRVSKTNCFYDIATASVILEREYQPVDKKILFKSISSQCFP